MNNRLSEEEKDEILARAKQSHKHSVGGGLLPKCPHCHGTGIDPTIPNYNNPPNSKPEQLGNEAGVKSVSGGHYTLMCKHKGGNCSCLGGFCLFDD